MKLDLLHWRGNRNTRAGIQLADITNLSVPQVNSQEKSVTKLAILVFLSQLAKTGLPISVILNCQLVNWLIKCIPTLYVTHLSLLLNFIFLYLLKMIFLKNWNIFMCRDEISLCYFTDLIKKVTDDYWCLDSL